jgi:hypothetical protein
MRVKGSKEVGREIGATDKDAICAFMKKSSLKCALSIFKMSSCGN